MPTESLIRRRSYPVPVTFADLRAARCDSDFVTPWENSPSGKRRHARFRSRPPSKTVQTWWAASLKSQTGALDEVYAVIDGREVRVGTFGRDHLISSTGFGYSGIERDLAILSIKADEAGYWQNPCEIVHVLSERPVSFAAVERAVNVGWCAKGGAA